MTERLCSPTRARRAGPGDEGFSIMEAVVAALVLAVSAAIVASILINVMQVTTNSGKRTAAANLAASKVEIIRGMDATEIPDGSVTTTQTVGNTTYTIVQDATYQSSTGTGSACTGTGNLAYKRVTVRVSWPNMGTTKPVQTETLRTLGFDASSGGLDSTKGATGVQVRDSTGVAQSGATVTLKNSVGTVLGTQLTGADGCVVFTNLTAGTNVYAYATESGNVNIDGADTAASTGTGVLANKLSTTTLDLAPMSELRASYSAPSGAIIPSGMALRLRNSLWSGATSDRTPGLCASTPNAVCIEADGVTAARLFPGAYAMWAGACDDATPASPTYTSVNAGATATASVPLGAVKMTAATSSAIGRTVTAVHAADTDCTSGQSIVLGALPASGSLTYALPAGSWTLSTSTGNTPVVITTGSTLTQAVS